ncbi:hypothetical protein [Anabaena azotica]|uniref:hypothetical protein n=1 Tax=Anabaena azotica TaxID=197653 RepID=UPI0039A5E260
MLDNLLRNIETNVRITSIVILCIVASFIFIPKMTELTITFNSLMVNGFSDPESSNLTKNQVNRADQNIYIPPNYGAPDSQHGSGTR